MLTSDKIIEIFVKVDDFCKEFESEIIKPLTGASMPGREKEVAYSCLE
jgi:hypothetical protein